MDPKDALRALTDFGLQCCFTRLTKKTPKLRLRVRQICTELSPDTMQLANFIMASLLKKMKDRNLLSDDTSQFVPYQIQANIVILSMNEDIQNAVWETESMSATIIHIQITTADDHD